MIIKKVITIVTILIALISCDSRKKGNEPTTDTTPTVTIANDPEQILRQSIIGRWRLPERNTLFLAIDNSTIQYLEGYKSPYYIRGNYIIMPNPDGSTDTLEAKREGDTLLLKNTNDIDFIRHVIFY